MQYDEINKQQKTYLYILYTLEKHEVLEQRITYLSMSTYAQSSLILFTN